MKPVLEFNNVIVSFGGLKAVNDVSFTIEEGQIFGLIGPNGAGKTTVFNTITGFYKPDSGEIRFLGEPIEGKPTWWITRKGICRTFQNIRVFKQLTVLDNVRIALHEAAEYGLLDAGTHATKKFRQREEEIIKVSDELLGGIGLLEERSKIASQLPYGKQRELEIARALALKPKLLLLDEPAAGMNPTETMELGRYIKSIRDNLGITIFVIEHHMDLVMGICEEVAVMDFGVKIAEGTPDVVKNNPQVISAYLGQEVSTNA
ncbi:ABC transporter ATP-binding protein [Coprothermobacter platensis]|jgi:branched-chain amino acid transport system ATP-binding protein|uniref:ABC transporter ATP-binding protein n=1 Tax=Coprothermobacter platensis TaxID=108819 RepID=UPI000380865F|nr:ABC transporter ATP-binding protein [Coprothermobacter platensis]